MVTISKNTNKGGIELAFPSKPADEVLAWIKSKGFGWSKYNKVWWRKFDNHTWNAVHEYFTLPVPELIPEETIPETKTDQSTGEPTFHGVTANEFILLDITASLKSFARNEALKRNFILDQKDSLKASLVKKRLMLKSGAINEMGRTVRKSIIAEGDYNSGSYYSGYDKIIQAHWNKPVPVKERPSAWIKNNTNWAHLISKIQEKHGGTELDISQQFDLGREIEKEHSDDSVEQTRIAFDHIWEDPKYYTKAKPANWAEKELEKEGKTKELRVIEFLNTDPKTVLDFEYEGNFYSYQFNKGKGWGFAFVTKYSNENSLTNKLSVSDPASEVIYSTSQPEKNTKLGTILETLATAKAAELKQTQPEKPIFWKWTKQQYRDYWTKKYEQWDESFIQKSPTSDKWYAVRPDGNPTTGWATKKLAIERIMAERISIISMIKNGNLDWEHKAHIENAIEAGEEIPAKVLADYPELNKQSIKTIESDIATQEAEQERVESQVPGSIRPDFMTKNAMIKGREIQISMPNGEKRNGLFAIIELNDITASHNEDNFHSEPGYPKNATGNNINDRNYKDDLAAQKAVMDYARELEPERLITTSRTPSGTPIITKDGFVVSGNNRTMSLKLAAKQYPDNYIEYKKFLAEEAESYGLEHSFVYQDVLVATDKNNKTIHFNYPVLVRIDLDFPEYTTQELSKYNKDTKKAERPIDKAIKLSNILRDNSRCAEIIADITGEYETFTEFYANIAAQKKLTKTLIECNLLTEQELPAYFSETTFTETGKEFIENLLAALILDREALMATEQPGVKATRQKLITSLPVLMKNANLPEGSLKKNINDAVILQQIIKASGSEFADFIRQANLFGTKYDKKTVYMNRLMNQGKLVFKGCIEKYNAAIMMNQGPSLFGEKPSNNDIFNQFIKKYVDSTEQRLIEKSDLVSSGDSGTKREPKFKAGDYVKYEGGDVFKEHWSGIIREVRDLDTEYVYRIDAYAKNEDGQVLFDDAKTNEKYEVQLSSLSTESNFSKLKEQYEQERQANRTIKENTPIDEAKAAEEKHDKIHTEFLRFTNDEDPKDRFKIYLVNGNEVRKDHIEFTMGGHGYVYDYVPKDEIWIDENLKDKPDDMEATIKHEVFEVHKMKDEGLDYESAHELANAMEKEVRKDNELDLKAYTTEQLKEMYSFEKGFNLSYLELDNLSNGTTTSYYSVSKLKGTYPHFERTANKDFIYSDYKWYIKVREGQYVETRNPYKNNEAKKEARKPGNVNTDLDVIDGGKAKTDRYQFLNSLHELDLWQEFEGRHYRKFLLSEKGSRAVTDLGIKESMRDVKKNGIDYLEAIISIPSINSSLEDEIEAAYQENTGIEVILNKKNDIRVVTERPVGKNRVILMQNRANSQMKSVTLPEDEVNKFNRNKQADIDVLWSMAHKLENQPTKLPIVKNGDKEYFVDFKLQEIRDVHTTESVPFTTLNEAANKELLAKLRQIRAEFGPNVSMPGLDEPEAKELKKISLDNDIVKLLSFLDSDASAKDKATMWNEGMSNADDSAYVASRSRIVKGSGKTLWQIASKARPVIEVVSSGEESRIYWFGSTLKQYIAKELKENGYDLIEAEPEQLKDKSLPKKWEQILEVSYQSNAKPGIATIADDIIDLYPYRQMRTYGMYNDKVLQTIGASKKKEKENMFYVMDQNGSIFMESGGSGRPSYYDEVKEIWGDKFADLAKKEGGLLIRDEQPELSDKKQELLDEIESLEKNIRNGEKLMTNPHFTGDVRPDIAKDRAKLEKKKQEYVNTYGAIPEKQAELSLNTSDYKNEFELNKAIEKLLDSKWTEKADKWSAEELEFLKGYSGYGGLDEFGEITKGSLFEYFTPDQVIEKMWGLAYKYGYTNGPVLEPSCGIGPFFDRRFVSNTIEKHGYEINKYSAKIAKLLYPEAIINDGEEVKYFEQLFIIKNYTVRSKVTPRYRLVIGNPPYGTVGGIYMGMGEKAYTHANNYIDYFILRGLDLLEKGGLLIFIIGAETAGGGVPFLDQNMNKVKEMINERGKLIDAYRLPSGVFSRTEVTSDIVVFRKR